MIAHAILSLGLFLGILLMAWSLSGALVWIWQSMSSPASLPNPEKLSTDRQTSDLIRALPPQTETSFLLWIAQWQSQNHSTTDILPRGDRHETDWRDASGLPASASPEGISADITEIAEDRRPL